MKVPFRFILAALLMAGVILSFAGCDKKIDLHNKANYWVKIDGVQYKPGDPYSKFIEKFEEPHKSSKEVKPEGKIDSIFEKQNSADYLSIAFTAEFYNPTVSPKPMSECVLSSISIDGAYIEIFDHQFIGGIKVEESTTDDVKRIFGEPTSRLRIEGKQWVWTYHHGVYNHSKEEDYDLIYEFTFSQETEILLFCRMSSSL